MQRRRSVREFERALDWLRGGNAWVKECGLSALRLTETQSRAGGGFLLEGVIGRTDKRAGFDVLESHSLAEPLEFGEFVRMDETVDR